MTYGAEKRTLINSSDFALNSNNDPAVILAHSEDLESHKLNSLVLHSSDAHNLDKIGQTKLWIKADLTFAGLKQVLNEPRARVFIGDTPPSLKPDHKVISSISIEDSNGWFEKNFLMELNPDLITIIGGRGSGKSALAEALAYGAGALDPSEDAFLKKASKHKDSIIGTKILLNWADGQSTEFVVGQLNHDQELIRYLPQGVVEELCSHKNSKKLQRQIENVIFQALDKTQKMGASDFDELKASVLKSSEDEKEYTKQQILEINEKIAQLETIIESLPEKQKSLESKKTEVRTLTASLPILPKSEEQGQIELTQLNDLKKRFENSIITLQRKAKRIVELESKIKTFRHTLSQFNEEIATMLDGVGINDPEPFKVSYDENQAYLILKATSKEFLEKIETLRTGSKSAVAAELLINEEELLIENYSSLLKAIDLKQKQTNVFETTKLKYQQQKKTITAIEGDISALEDEIQKITRESDPQLQKLKKDRWDFYFKYFGLLSSEKSEIENLYAPLQKSLQSGTETDKKLIFEAKIEFHQEDQNRRGLDILDRTRRGSFRDSGALNTALRELWENFTRSGYETEVLKTETEKIEAAFRSFENAPISINEQLRESYSLKDFYDWLFDPSVFTTVSSLKFSDTDLYLLSPGQKGIILLLLYLKIDEADYRPLIIDQPEENLDNLSIYTDLMDYFRNRKQYRQIIMVTHNPNLVVNTDSEQVIVANYDGKARPRLSYTSGSLENQAQKIPDVKLADLKDGVIEQVCNILEGGDSAFTKRKKKYQLSEKSKLDW